MTSPFVLRPDEAENLVRGLDRGETLPLSWYTDPAVAAAEERAIFRKSWQYVGRAADVAETGMFITADIAGVPIIVTRDRNGDLNAFHNVCRHRAAKVIQEPCGQRRALSCHYHAWTYGLDGSLKGAPRSEREPGFPKEELGLRRASAATWGPFLFAHLDEDAPSLEQHLADVPGLVAGAQIDVDDLRFAFRIEYDLDCNWKVAIENYLECYHCPTAHPGFDHVLDTKMDTYRLTVSDTYAWQNGPLRPVPDGVPVRQDGYTGRDGHVPEGRYFMVFPSLKFNINPGLPNVSIGPMEIRGANQTHGYLDYYFGSEVGQQWIDDMMEFDNQVGAEDTALVESVQLGIKSGSLERGRILLQSEKLVSGFHHWMLDQLVECEEQS